MGKHVAKAAVCSPATSRVLDEFAAALMVLVGTVLQAQYLQNVLLFVYLTIPSSQSHEQHCLPLPQKGIETSDKT